MSDRPAISGPVDEPSAERYDPKVVSEHCEAAKDLLGFLRQQGIRCEVLEVGINGVRMVGIVDDYPRKRPVAAPPTRAGDDGREYED